MATLAIYTYTHNCLKIKLPFLESIRSALTIADEVHWCDCESTDGTYEAALELALTQPRLILHRHPWGKEFTIQPKICNHVLNMIGFRFDFTMLLQADEVICEWTGRAFRDQLRAISVNVGLLRPYYRNFIGDYRTVWPFIYDRKATVARASMGTRWDEGGDACALVGRETIDAQLEIHHYTKISLGRRKEALEKELFFQEMYRGLGSAFPAQEVLDQAPSGELDYKKLPSSHNQKPFYGRHPLAMHSTIHEVETNTCGG